jgi:DNA repair protein RecO (recombination protein O)
LTGQDWLDLQHALDDEAAMTSTLRLCAQWPQETRQSLQTQLRHLLHYHCGVQTLRTRQVLMDLQAL